MIYKNYFLIGQPGEYLIAWDNKDLRQVPRAWEYVACRAVFLWHIYLNCALPYIPIRLSWLIRFVQQCPYITLINFRFDHISEY